MLNIKINIEIAGLAEPEKVFGAISAITTDMNKTEITHAAAASADPLPSIKAAEAEASAEEKPKRRRTSKKAKKAEAPVAEEAAVAEAESLNAIAEEEPAEKAEGNPGDATWAPGGSTTSESALADDSLASLSEEEAKVEPKEEPKVEYTFEQLRKLCLELYTASGNDKDAVSNIIMSLGHANLSNVPESEYATLAASLEKAIAEHKANK